MALQIEAGDDAGRAAALFFAAAAAMFADDLGLAIERFDRCVALSEALGLPAIEARARQLLGVSSLELGDVAGATAALGKGVPAIVDIGDRFAIPVGLSALAGLAAKTGRPRAALRLAGAAAAYEEVNQTYRPQKIGALLDAWLTPVRTRVGAAVAKLFDQGRGLTLDQAIELGLDTTPEDPWRPGRSAGLTRREREIAALVATGLTNREIAGKLYLSVRTVEVHVDHALTKLGFRTRTSWRRGYTRKVWRREVRSGYVVLLNTPPPRRFNLAAMTENASLLDCQVLVVGAGPAGLATAITAIRNGARALVVERHPGTSIYPPATGVHLRTVELLRTGGLAA